MERGRIYTPKYIYMTAHLSGLVYRTGSILFSAKPAVWVLEQPRVDSSSVGPLKHETQLGANWLKASSGGIGSSIKSRGIN